MRFHPKRRASTDHRPGPNIERAAPRVAISRYIKRSAGTVTSLPHSMRATTVPTMGVYSPMARRIAATPKKTDNNVMGMPGLPSRADPAPFAKAKPTTSRIKMSPIPGQPPAKVEYKRRNWTHLSFTYSFSYDSFTNRAPQRGRIQPLSRRAE